MHGYRGILGDVWNESLFTDVAVIAAMRFSSILAFSHALPKLLFETMRRSARTAMGSAPVGLISPERVWEHHE